MALKRLMTTTALGFALAVTPAIAGEVPTPDSTDTQSMRHDSMDRSNVKQPNEAVAGKIGEIAFLRDITRDQHLASSIIGKPVYDSTDRQIGDVNDLVTSSDGKIVAAVIGVGGFMGVNEKSVAVPYELLRTIQPSGGALKVTARFDPEKLKSAPSFNPSRETSRNAGGTDAGGLMKRTASALADKVEDAIR